MHSAERYWIGDEDVNNKSSNYMFSIQGWTTTENISGSISLLGSTTDGYLEARLEEEDRDFRDLWAHLNADNLRHGLWWTVTLVIAYMVILIVGTVGNCMVILVIAIRPQMRTVTNLFVLNLAVADLLVIVFCVPATLLANVLRPWILGSVMCKGVAYVQGVSVCASVYSLGAISLDRCMAISRPMRRPSGLSKTQASFTICLIWLLALSVTIPWAVVFDVLKSHSDGLIYCTESWGNEVVGKVYFLLANLITCYSLPLLLISICNVVIWYKVSRREVPQHSASVRAVSQMHQRTRHGVRKMLGIVTLSFLLSWLPLYLLATIIKFSLSEGTGEATKQVFSTLVPIAQWLGISNSSLNPVLYAFLNTRFREGFKNLLPQWMMCKWSTTKHLEEISRRFVVVKKASSRRPLPLYEISVGSAENVGRRIGSNLPTRQSLQQRIGTKHSTMVTEL